MKNFVFLQTKPALILFLLLALLLLPGLACNLPDTGGGRVTTIQSPEHETVISQKNVTVVVPAGTVPQDSPVSIREVTAKPEGDYSGLKALGAYEITIGDQLIFQNPLEIQIQYDTADLRKDVPAQDQFFVAYLDETVQRWVETDFTLDETGSKVIISADHLTIWALFGLEDGVAVSYAPHFKIYFNEKLNAPLLSDKPSGAGLIFDFASQVRAALADAYDRYAAGQGTSNTGFKLPEQTQVYIDDWGVEKTAEWGWFSKNIEIPTSYSDLQELNQDSAHELFHAAQNQYMRVPTMLANRWWMEATADYAAARVGTSNGLKTNMGLDFIKKPLDDGDTKHMYRVSHFIDYLVSQGVDFKDLFEATISAGDPIRGMEDHLRSAGLALDELYTGFASSFIFGTKLQREPLPTGSLTDMADYKDEYNRERISASTLVAVPAHYAARLAAYALTDNPGVTYTAVLSALEPGPSVQVRYAVSSDSSPDGIYQMGELEGGKPEKVDLRGGEVVFFLVTNGGGSQETVTVAIDRPAGVSTYENTRTATLYNKFYTVDVSFTLTSNAPFEIVREMVAPNGETLILDLRMTTGLKGAVLNATATASNLQLAEPTAHPNLIPSIYETQWSLSDGSQISGGTANLTFAGDNPKPGSMSFDIITQVVNKLDSSSAPGGSGSVITIRVGE